MASAFLPCDIIRLPFMFLGISVGVNHRRKETWLPIISKLTKRLSSWRGKNLSLGDKVTLLNFVLNKIPTHICYHSLKRQELCGRK